MHESTIEDGSIPWYKLPIVWFIIAIPVSAIVFGMFMLWLAISSNDGLVADDYYKQGMAINKSLARDQAALDYGVKAGVEINNANGIIRMNLDKGTLPEYPDIMLLKCLHATRAGMDVIIELHHGIGDQYIGHLQQALSEGVWNMELGSEGWRLQQRVKITGTDTVVLQFGGKS